jgi:hypothetical protein
MKGLILLLVIILAAISFTAITANNTNVVLEGHNWATKACSSAPSLCHYPYQVAYGAIGLTVLWIVMVLFA